MIDLWYLVKRYYYDPRPMVQIRSKMVCQQSLIRQIICRKNTHTQTTGNRWNTQSQFRREDLGSV